MAVAERAVEVAALPPTPTQQEKRMPQDNPHQEAPPAPVVTGLVGITLPPPPAPEATPAEDPTIAARKQHDEIQATLMAAKAEETAALRMKNEANDPHRTSVRNRNQQIYDQILANRNQPAAVQVIAPLAPEMSERTKKEIEVGAQTSLKAAQQRLTAFQSRKPDARPGVVNETTAPVPRPNDYVPDQQKKQGYVEIL